MKTLDTPTPIYDRLGITPAQLTEFCQRWQVQELALFGSILREDFQPDRSDVDLFGQSLAPKPHLIDGASANAGSVRSAVATIGRFSRLSRYCR